jgi:dipeptidyl aminopeptidase/acylaminoacyl peptidase
LTGSGPRTTLRAVLPRGLVLAIAAVAASASPGAASHAASSTPPILVTFANVDVETVDPATGARERLPADPAGAHYSDDGTKLVYTLGQTLAVADADGENVEQILVGAAGFADSPSLSPDNRRIVFVGSGSHLYTIGVDGSGLQQITGSAGTDLTPVWSPRGDEIAFTRVSPGGWSELYVVGASGGDRQLTFGAPASFSSSPAWSPDGSWLAYDELDYRGGHVAIIRPDGTGHREITPSFPRPFGYASPAWSPDGQRIAFNPAPSRVDAIGVDQSNWTTLIRSGPSDVNALSWRPVTADVTPVLPRVDSLVARAPFTVEAAVRSAGFAGAQGVEVVVGVTGRASIAGASLGGGTCTTTAGTARCTAGSMAGDTSAPLRILIAPRAPGPLSLSVRATAANDAIAGDEAVAAITSVSSCTVLGTTGDDRIHARGAGIVCGLEGDDVIDTRNGKRNEVDCGAGIDRLRADRIDSARHCERVSRPPARRA